MGEYVNNNTVTLRVPYDYDDVVKEIAELVGVGRREDGTYRLADICQAERINPLARCKPFRYPSHYFSNKEERAAARGKRATGAADDGPNNGFGTTPQIHVANSEISHGVYEYKKPRGGATEPSRLFDFDGYFHKAGNPLQITFDSQAWKDDMNYVIVNVQHTSTNWNSEDCLLLHEFLDDNNKERYFALLITGGGYSWLMPTTVSPYDMQGNQQYTFSVVFHNDANKLASYGPEYSPTVWKDIDAVREGTEMTIALVLSNTGYTGESLPANGDFGSLEFVKNSDRTKVKLASSMTLAGLTYDYQPTSWGSFESISAINGYRAFEWKNIEDLLTVNTPSRWNRTFVTARVTIAWIYGNVYDELHNVVSDQSTMHFSYDVSIQTSKFEQNMFIPIPNGTFSSNLFGDDKMWKYKFAVEDSSISSIYVPVQISIVRTSGSEVLEEIRILDTTLTFNIG